MANWNQMTITNAGLALQAKVNSGSATFKIAGLAIGSGQTQGNLGLATDLAHKEIDIPINNMTVNNNIVSIEGVITNQDVTSAFMIREMGLYAQNGDDTSTKILYGIMTDPNPDSMPAHGTATVVSQKFTLNLTMSNTGSITATIDANALLTLKNLQDHNTNASAHSNLLRVTSMSATESGLSYMTQDNQGHAITLLDKIKAKLTGAFTPNAQTNTILQQLDGLAHQIKAITGKSNWFDAPDKSMADLITATAGVSAIEEYDVSNANAWWFKLRGAPGIIIQGGTGSVPGDGGWVFKFPIAFASPPLVRLVTAKDFSAPISTASGDAKSMLVDYQNSRINSGAFALVIGI